MSVACRQSCMMQEKANREVLMQSDAIGITAWIKQPRVEPLTCWLIIQQLTGPAIEIYADREEGL